AAARVGGSAGVEVDAEGSGTGAGAECELRNRFLRVNDIRQFLTSTEESGGSGGAPRVFVPDIKIKGGRIWIGCYCRRWWRRIGIIAICCSKERIKDVHLDPHFRIGYPFCSLLVFGQNQVVIIFDRFSNHFKADASDWDLGCSSGRCRNRSIIRPAWIHECSITIPAETKNIRVCGEPGSTACRKA